MFSLDEPGGDPQRSVNWHRGRPVVCRERFAQVLSPLRSRKEGFERGQMPQRLAAAKKSLRERRAAFARRKARVLCDQRQFFARGVMLREVDHAGKALPRRQPPGALRAEQHRPEPPFDRVRRAREGIAPDRRSVRVERAAFLVRQHPRSASRPRSKVGKSFGRRVIGRQRASKRFVKEFRRTGLSERFADAQQRVDRRRRFVKPTGTPEGLLGHPRAHRHHGAEPGRQVPAGAPQRHPRDALARLSRVLARHREQLFFAIEALALCLRRGHHRSVREGVGGGRSRREVSRGFPRACFEGRSHPNDSRTRGFANLADMGQDRKEAAERHVLHEGRLAREPSPNVGHRSPPQGPGEEGRARPHGLGPTYADRANRVERHATLPRTGETQRHRRQRRVVREPARAVAELGRPQDVEQRGQRGVGKERQVGSKKVMPRHEAHAP